jgi:2,3-bisphosphoglycerate-independent phosphoglycerate mutase
MNAQNARPRPLVLAVLDARPPALGVLEQRYPHARVRLEDADAITQESLTANQVVQRTLRKAKDMGGRLHLIGLVSDGGVQSSLAHLFALIDMAKSARVRVVVHALLDGVDVPPRSATRYIRELEAKLDGGVGRIGTVSGRALGMDCEARWERVEKVYRAITADGTDRIDSALRGIDEACAFGNPEGFLKPFIVFDYPGVSLVDSALHFNFGADGARALTHALAGTRFDRFARKGGRAPFGGRLACMTPYDTGLALPTLFPRAPDPSNLPLELLTSAGYAQVQYANGTASALAKASEAAIRSGQYDFVLADFANPDNTDRGGPAQALDGALGQIVEAARAVGGAVVILSGRDATNTSSLLYVNEADHGARVRDGGALGDLAPTLLALLQLRQPADVAGASLLIR